MGHRSSEHCQPAKARHSKGWPAVGSVAFTGVALVATAASCSAPGKGALILAVSTDMQTPKDVDVISVFIATKSVPKFDYLGRVAPDGTVTLPSTLAIVEPDEPSAEVHIRVVAFQEQKARVLRDVLTTVPHERTALLRVPLDFLDDGSGQGMIPVQYVPGGPTGAPEGQTEFDPTDPRYVTSRCDFTGHQETSINGKCTSADVASSDLPNYSDDQVFGPDGSAAQVSCFSVTRCLAGAITVAGLDTTACSFVLPSGTDVAHLNLALATPGTGSCLGSQCFVPLDGGGGGVWTLQGNRVNLDGGVCAKVMQGAQLYVASQSACAPKDASMPVCEPASSPGDAGSMAAVDAATDTSTLDATTPDGTMPDATISDAMDAATEEAMGVSIDATADADAASDASISPPSCQAGGSGLDNCGTPAESCCASLEVAGGPYDRTYVVGDGGVATGLADPATVSGFRLDKYDVTVGRFRQFVSAWNGGAGYLPPAGSGTHAHLNGGSGLVVVPSEGAASFEPGWLASDDANIAPTDANLACDPSYSTWTSTPGANELLPIDCENWWEAYAFCIWDGGFLPTEAEWECAAAGGSQQRLYPWGSTNPGTTNQYAIYGDGAGNCYYPTGALALCSSDSNIAPVGSAPLGAGLWGQLDLVGDTYNWNLDWYGTYMNPCTDCANLQSGTQRILRGARFSDPPSYLLPPQRLSSAPATRLRYGFRCARTP